MHRRIGYFLVRRPWLLWCCCGAVVLLWWLVGSSGNVSFVLFVSANADIEQLTDYP